MICLQALRHCQILSFFFFFLASSATESSGEEAFVETLSGGGGVALGTQFGVITGPQGKWLIFSIVGEDVAPSFFLLTILETESLSAKGCKEGSVNLQNGVITDPFVRSSTIPLQVEKKYKWSTVCYSHDIVFNFCRDLRLNSVGLAIM